MKQFIFAAIAGLALVTAQESLPKCMYCKRNDENSGFLNSWSYCESTDTCLHNAWNYIQRECPGESGGWQSGHTYVLDRCNPSDTSCPEYVSDPEKYQTYSNNTWSLSSGGKCTIKIDATKGVARVVFDYGVTNSQLGIDTNNWKTGDVVSFEAGENEIVIYNANESGPLTFEIAFSGASTLAAAAGVAATAIAMAF